MSSNPPGQYATDGNLAARQRLWQSSRREPRFDLFPWVLDLAGVVTGDERRILDVGCGNGAYETALRSRGHRGLGVAVDLSAGMLLHVADATPLQADVQSLPLEPESFDLVLAPHMLYHVADIEAAVAEARRVLRPDGLFIAVTNSVSNLAELRTLVEIAVGTGWQMVRPADQYFNLEHGAGPLATSFRSVTRVDCPPSQVVVTDLDAVVGYVASVGDHYEAEVDRPWSDVVDRVGELVAATLASGRPLRFTAAAGAFVCR